MAQIVIGIATLHGTMLSTPSDQWTLRVAADKGSPNQAFLGSTRVHNQLLTLRSVESQTSQLSSVFWCKRHSACKRAIARLAEVFWLARRDAVLIFGNDQTELFSDDNLPAFSSYYEKMIENQEYHQEYIERLSPGNAVSVVGHIPPEGSPNQGDPGLGLHVIGSLVSEGFDVATLQRLPRNWLDHRDIVLSADEQGRNTRMITCVHKPGPRDQCMQERSFMFDEPLAWNYVSHWLGSLAYFHGKRLLRVKRTLALADDHSAAVIHGVCHLLHEPAKLLA